MIKTIMQPVKPHSNKHKVSDLTLRQLDWAVATALGVTVYISKQGKLMTAPYGSFNHRKGAPWWFPSISWEQGGTIIEREEINILNQNRIVAWQRGRETFGAGGPTPLIAAMRCYVASKLGDDVEIPEEMMEQA